MDTYAPIITTVDVVLFSLQTGILSVGLLRRGGDPYKNQLALPGGYIHAEEDANDVAAALRVLKAKTGMCPPYLEQLQTFAGGARDPRGWSVSIAYFALVNPDTLQVNPAVDFVWQSVDQLGQLPFDHNRIISAGIERLRNKSSYSSMPCYLLGNSFTLSELQNLYQQLLGDSWNPSAFRRKLGITAKGIGEHSFLEEDAGGQRLGNHRPAKLYRLKDAERLSFFDRTL